MIETQRAAVTLVGPTPLRRRPPTVRLAPVFHFVGMIVNCLGAAMLMPAMVDLAYANRDASVFLFSAGTALFVGSSLVLATRGSGFQLGHREGVLATVTTWIAAALVGALPFLLADKPLSLVDAIFETISGLTATGSSVYVGLDQAPPGILLWRFLLIWLGGFGLVTFAVLALPYLRVGGLQFFMLDLSARPGKFLPKVTAVIAQIAICYVILTGLCTLAFAAAGMNGFDAVGHAMAAIATGGFSSHDAGLGYFQSPAIEWIATVFMLLSALPFVLYVHLLHGQARPLLSEDQVRLFLVMIGTGIALLTVWLMRQQHVPFWDALRQASFNLVSLITTTGFTSHDFSLWGAFPGLILVTAMLVGGCTGSTAGGIKMFRLWILLRAVGVQLGEQVFPSGIFRVTYNGRRVSEEVQQGAIVYFFVYLSTVALLSLALGLSGLDFIEAVSASATALGGVGPALGPRIGPCCTFTSVSDMTKWLLALGMLAGRLEILLLVVPFTRLFWRA